MLASSLLGQAYSLMIATISPSASALRHTRNTLGYAGTAASISLAAPKAAADDLSLRNAELEKKNKCAARCRSLLFHHLRIVSDPNEGSAGPRSRGHTLHK